MDSLDSFLFLSAASSGVSRRLTRLGIHCHRKDAFDAQSLSEQAVNDISEELMPPHLLSAYLLPSTDLNDSNRLNKLNIIPHCASLLPA